MLEIPGIFPPGFSEVAVVTQHEQKADFVIIVWFSPISCGGVLFVSLGSFVMQNSMFSLASRKST